MNKIVYNIDDNPDYTSFSGYGYKISGIYVIYCKEINRIKIGQSENILRRLKDYKTGFPFDKIKGFLGCVATSASCRTQGKIRVLETWLHNWYGKIHTNTHLEWFCGDEHSLDMIAAELKHRNIKLETFNINLNSQNQLTSKISHFTAENRSFENPLK